MIMSVSLAVLLPGEESMVPDGTAIVAVLVTMAPGGPLTRAMTSNRSDWPTPRLTVAASGPVHAPGTGQVAVDAAGMHAQLGLVSAAGRAVLTVAPVATLGPLLVAITV